MEVKYPGHSDRLNSGISIYDNNSEFHITPICLGILYTNPCVGVVMTSFDTLKTQVVEAFAHNNIEELKIMLIPSDQITDQTDADSHTSVIGLPYGEKFQWLKHETRCITMSILNLINQLPGAIDWSYTRRYRRTRMLPQFLYDNEAALFEPPSYSLPEQCPHGIGIASTLSCSEIENSWF